MTYNKRFRAALAMIAIMLILSAIVPYFMVIVFLIIGYVGIKEGGL